jgi:CPA2 family monovalent cation:H+ antiporter-2
MGALQVVLRLLGGPSLTVAVWFGQPLAGGPGDRRGVALSSTAMVMPLLAESKRQHSMAGRATFSVLLFQDLAVAPILITLTIIGSAGRRRAVLAEDAADLRARGAHASWPSWCSDACCCGR